MLKYYFISLSICLSCFLFSEDTSLFAPNKIRITVQSSFMNHDNSYDQSGKLADNKKMIKQDIKHITQNYFHEMQVLRSQLDETFGYYQFKTKTEFFEFNLGIDFGLSRETMIGVYLPIKNNSMNIEKQFKFNNAVFQRLVYPPNMIFSPSEQAMIEIYDQLLKTKGYKTDNSIHSEGVGDLVLETKHLLYYDKSINIVFKGGVVIPTGSQENPNDLFDDELSLGDGQYDLLGGILFDYRLFYNLCLGISSIYHYQIPDQSVKNIPLDSQTMWGDRGSVRRELGAIYNNEFYTKLDVQDYLQSNIRYQWIVKEKDLYRSKQFGIDRLSLLSDNTDRETHQLSFGLAFNAIPFYKAEKIRLPFQTEINYTLPLAGINTLKVSTLSLTGKLYF